MLLQRYRSFPVLYFSMLPLYRTKVNAYSVDFKVQNSIYFMENVQTQISLMQKQYKTFDEFNVLYTICAYL